MDVKIQDTIPVKYFLRPNTPSLPALRIKDSGTAPGNADLYVFTFSGTWVEHLSVPHGLNQYASYWLALDEDDSTPA